MNPIEIYGDGLSCLLTDMIREARKEEKKLQSIANRACAKFKKWGLPNWRFYHHAHHTGLTAQLFWNERVLENLSHWYVKAENLMEASEWEENYDYAKGITIDRVCRDLYPNGNYKRSVCCPLHKERSPSFHVYLDTNSWFCFGCNRGGSPIDYVMHRHNLDFKEAVKFLSTH